MKLLLLTIAVLSFSGCNESIGFAQVSDERLAMAIYYAEGGRAAQYPFGIRSVRCVGYTECKERCKATIRHNRRRFAQITGKGHESFIDYLARRYRTSKRGTLPPSDLKAIAVWEHNVKCILAKEGYRNANIE